VALKSVLILGSGVGFCNKREEITNFTQPGISKLLGDVNKKTGIQKKQLYYLKGIDPNTRIDINAHGLASNPFAIRLNESECIDVKDLFSILGTVNQKSPLYLHLWSCYSGSAQDYIGHLPNGSILVTHVVRDHIAIVGLSNLSIIKLATAWSEYHLSNPFLPKAVRPFQAFLDNLPFEIMQGVSVGVIKEGKVCRFDVQLSLVDVLLNPKEVLQKIGQRFRDFIVIERLEGYRDIKVPDFSDEAVEAFKLGYLISYGVYREEETLSALKQLDLSTDFFKKPLDTMTLLDSAILCNKKQLINYILKEKGLDPSDRSHFLLVAAMNCKANDMKDAMVELLLQNGANPNLSDNENITPLHYAAMNGYENIVKLLLQNGANPNLSHNENIAPLHWAILKGYLNIAKLLLEAGADPNETTKSGLTSLHIASQKGNMEIIKRLLESDKIDPNKLDAGGYSPLHHALFYMKISTVKFLLKSNKFDLHVPKELTLFKVMFDIVILLVTEVIIKNIYKVVKSVYDTLPEFYNYSLDIQLENQAENSNLVEDNLIGDLQNDQKGEGDIFMNISNILKRS